MVTTTSYLAGLHRRREAAADLRPMLCGCRDPWPCRHYEEPVSITDQFVDGYRDACEHLLAEGLTPAPNVDALRVMWRRGGQEQRLAMRITELWEGVA